MKPTPFDPETDLAPIPFSPEVCKAAERLKQSGLTWHPHVGCFVWDKDEQIDAPSPFPNRVYFVLNIGHFLRRFQTLEQMAGHLVWLPTWHQARQIYTQLQLPPERLRGRLLMDNQPERDLIMLYELLRNEFSNRRNVSMRPTPEQQGSGQESVWNYPRPPKLAETNKHITILFNEVLIADTSSAKRAAWSYLKPTTAFSGIQGCVAFYAHLMDACVVNGEQVQPQQGDFYGGWITRDIVGPFKGSPESWTW